MPYPKHLGSSVSLACWRQPLTAAMPKATIHRRQIRLTWSGMDT